MEEFEAAIKKIIQYKTIRGNFSFVHPDLAAEGITRVEVGEEGLHFIRATGTGLIKTMQHYKTQTESWLKAHIFAGDKDEEEMLRRAIAMSLEVETEGKESFSIKGNYSLLMS